MIKVALFQKPISKENALLRVVHGDNLVGSISAHEMYCSCSRRCKLPTRCALTFRAVSALHAALSFKAL